VSTPDSEGSEMVQADAGAPALSEKVITHSEWLPIETAPRGPNIILAFRNDAGKWRRVIGWHAKQFEIEVDADELHSGLEEGPAGEAIYAKSGWYEYLDADEAPCNRIWPTHWMPLPSPPGAELTISNHAERADASLNQSSSSASTVEKLREALALCAGGFEGEGLEIENEWRRTIARNALNGVPLSEYERLEARAALSSIPAPSTEADDR
jgi:hypothetical protein